MQRWWSGAVLVAACAGAALLGTPAVGATGVSLHVTPNRGLADGQVVAVSGRGLWRSEGGKPLTWFLVECTSAVQGRMDPDTDTPHCDVTEGKAVHVTKKGTFSAHFAVESGIVGDGYCGTAASPSCVLVLGTVNGHGASARITFKVPAPAATTTTDPASTTTS
jgi:hypothetical protein